MFHVGKKKEEQVPPPPPRDLPKRDPSCLPSAPGDIHQWAEDALCAEAPLPTHPPLHFEGRPFRSVYPPPILLFGSSFSRRHLMFADLPVERGGASPPRPSVFCRELPLTTPEPRFCCSVPATSWRRSSTGSLVFLVRIVTFLCCTRGNDVRHKSFIFGVSLLLNSIFSA